MIKKVFFPFHLLFAGRKVHQNFNQEPMQRNEIISSPITRLNKIQIYLEL